MGAGKHHNIDLSQLQALMQFKPSLNTTAGFFKVSEDTITRRIKEAEDLTFAAFRRKYLATTQIKLVNRAIDRAMNGSDTMLIFCLKKLCDGWDDQPENNKDNFSSEDSPYKKKLKEMGLLNEE